MEFLKKEISKGIKAMLKLCSLNYISVEISKGLFEISILDPLEMDDIRNCIIEEFGDEIDFKVSKIESGDWFRIKIDYKNIIEDLKENLFDLLNKSGNQLKEIYVVLNASIVNRLIENEENMLNLNVDYGGFSYKIIDFMGLNIIPNPNVKLNCFKYIEI